MPLVLGLMQAKGILAPQRYLIVAPLLLVAAVIIALLGRRQRRAPSLAAGLAA